MTDKGKITLKVDIELGDLSNTQIDEDGYAYVQDDGSIIDSIIKAAAKQLATRVYKETESRIAQEAWQQVQKEIAAQARPKIEEILVHGVGGDEWTGNKPKTVKQLAYDWATSTGRWHNRSSSLEKVAEEVAREELKSAAGEFNNAIRAAKKELKEKFKEQLGEQAFKALKY